MEAARDAGDVLTLREQARHHAAADEAGAAEDHDLVGARPAGFGELGHGGRLGRGVAGEGVGPLRDAQGGPGVVGQVLARAQRAVEGLDRLLHPDEEGVLPGAEAEGEHRPVLQDLPRVLARLLGALRARQVAVPEVEPEGLLLAAELVVEEVGLEGAVAAEDLDGRAREGLAEGHVELGGPALGVEAGAPALDEGLAGVELGGLELVDRGALHRAEQVLELAEGVDRLLEDDVARRAEHPVAVVPRVELAEGNRESHLDVLDAPDLAGLDALHHAGEAGVEHVVVVHAEGEALGGGARQRARVVGAEGDGLLGEDADARLQQGPGEGHVQVGRDRQVRDVDAEARELGEVGHRVGRAEAPGGRLGPGLVHVADGHELRPPSRSGSPGGSPRCTRRPRRRPWSSRRVGGAARAGALRALGAPGGSVGGGHGVGEGGRGRGGGSHGDLIDRPGGGAQTPLGDRWNFVRPDSRTSLRRAGCRSHGHGRARLLPVQRAPFSCPEGRSRALGGLAEGAASQGTGHPAWPRAAGTSRSWRDGGRGEGAFLLARGAAAFGSTGRGREERPDRRDPERPCATRGGPSRSGAGAARRTMPGSAPAAKEARPRRGSTAPAAVFSGVKSAPGRLLTTRVSAPTSPRPRARC